MDLNLDNKRALVTGSTKGIGFAIARQLAQEGARVIVNGRSETSVADALACVRADVPNAHAEGFAADLSKSAAISRLVKQFPSVDVLVNNVGIFEPVPFEDIEDAAWQHLFEVNVMSGVRLSRAYLPGMKQRNWGRIVFISSESAIQIPAEMIHYGVTKTAQLGLSRGLAETCAGTGVTVNAVLPGPTRSEGVDEFVSRLSQGRPFEQFEQEFFRSVRPTSLLKRFETPDEIASLVTFVCSPLASGVNGAALRVDGGVVRAAF
jgi:NAD(P)-dependent dehydrogenase (short-subunit alcohol dehydrogenase family)